MKVRRAAERGLSHFDWLESYHTFSFSEYRDPNWVHFRSLRVINDDKIIGGSGFGTHGHRDAEIVTYVLEGAVEHKDSMGNIATIHAGEVQRMSAGTGITHSEYNHLQDDETHFLQIWFLPNKRGIEPSYDQQMIDDAKVKNQFTTIITPTPQDGEMSVAQDVIMSAARLEKDNATSYQAEEGRGIWLHVARGDITVNGEGLSAGDAAFSEETTTYNVEASTDAEIIIFDLGAYNN